MIGIAAFAKVQAIGGPLGIVTFSESLVEGFNAMTRRAGLDANLIAKLAVDTPGFWDPGKVQDRYAEEIADLCNHMYRRGASCVVIGGGPLAGLAENLAPSSPLPLIDRTQ